MALLAMHPVGYVAVLSTIIGLPLSHKSSEFSLALEKGNLYWYNDKLMQFLWDNIADEWIQDTSWLLNNHCC